MLKAVVENLVLTFQLDLFMTGGTDLALQNPLNLFHGRGPVKNHRISFEKTLWFQHQELHSILGDCVLVDGRKENNSDLIDRACVATHLGC